MSVRNLKQLFAPASVALVGASERPGSVGATMLRNLREGGFKGALYPVNPKYETLDGLQVWADVGDLPQAPDLAIICTPPATIPAVVRRLGELGTRAAIVMSAGVSTARDLRGRSIKQAMLDAANPYLLRILGPNSSGLLAPGLGLNASIAVGGAAPGRIAFVSESGALMAGVLDWARTRNVGFSTFVALGDSADVDFGDVLDYLASDPGTSAILVHAESVRYARKFMSAARAAARSKPTLMLKAGRSLEPPTAGACLSGVLARPDDVYDAAIRRAGMLRVYTTDQLFAAVETLARAKPLFGERLALIGNGAGPVVLAADALQYGGGHQAVLSAETVAKLRHLVPEWSGSGELNLRGDAPPERYRDVIDVLLHDPEAHGVVMIHAPNAVVDPADVARAVAPLAKASSRNVLACWLGLQSVGEARTIAYEAGMPAYRTPEAAVNGFLQIVHFRRNQQLLMEVPASIGDGEPDRDRARALVRAALDRGRRTGRYLLDDPDTKAILDAYGIPTVPTRAAATPDEAVAMAAEIGYPVAVKILSPDVVQKSDVGGVSLDLDTPEAVRAATERMAKRLAEGEEIANHSGYAIGVARMLLMEINKGRQREQSALAEIGAAPDAYVPEDDDESRLNCLRSCLQTLSPDNRELILQYYQGEKGEKIGNRKKLLERFGVPVNTLRMRALRVRERLQSCVEECLGRG